MAANLTFRYNGLPDNAESTAMHAPTVSAYFFDAATQRLPAETRSRLLKRNGIPVDAPIDAETRLFGEAGLLDSMGLVSLIVAVEQAIGDECGASVALADEKHPGVQKVMAQGPVNLAGPVKVSCSSLADRLDASSQTASRRLQRLDEAGYVERDIVSDGQWVSVTDTGEAALRKEYADYRRIFEEEASVTLTGTVTGGMGEGRHYISLSGYKRQFEERLGYEPFPGTLNVDLTEESVRARAAMSSLDAVPIDGWEDDDRTFGPATCYAATVEFDGQSYDTTHIIVPERTHHDETQLEIIAPDRLRDALDLDDGDTVSVRVEEATGVEGGAE